MMNVYRHARATRASLRLVCGPDFVTLDLEDNGIGFDPTAGSDGAIGLGIQSMIARAAEQGGSLSIERLARGTSGQGQAAPRCPPVICQTMRPIRCRGAASGKYLDHDSGHELCLRKKIRGKQGNPRYRFDAFGSILAVNSAPAG
jgi:hypothetical protein